MIVVAVVAIAVGIVYVVVGSIIDAQRLLYAGLGATFIATMWLALALVEAVYRRRSNG